MTEKDVLLDVAQRLERLNLAYMLTGSLASMYYGVPRFTHDIDLVIQIPPSAAERMAQAFRPDYFVDEQMIRAAFGGTMQFNLLHNETGIKVDFWLTRADAFHQAMFNRRKREQFEGQSLSICTAEDVVLHKLYWNKINPSERQLFDVRGVLRVRGDRLDWDYINSWARQLSVAVTLEELRKTL
jgi:hypothetical protein